MEKIYTIVNLDGKELYATIDILSLPSGQIAIEELRTEYIDNPYFNFETRIFYDKMQNN